MIDKNFAKARIYDRKQLTVVTKSAPLDKLLYLAKDTDLSSAIQQNFVEYAITCTQNNIDR